MSDGSGDEARRRPLLEAHGLTKRFEATVALSAVSLRVARGASHALVGENGAGKSTLLKILSGNLQPDSGTIELDGAPLRLPSPAAARRHGIAVIHQELSIIGELTVAENVFLGALPTGRLGRVDFKRLERDTRGVLAELGLDIEPRTAAGRLPIALQQMVEIAKGVASGARILIMDEPTSSLGAREAERLWWLAADLRAKGATILFVSHKLDEVLDNADTVTVLRDGRQVATHPAGELDPPRLVALMVGRELGERAPQHPRAAGKPLLLVHGLSRGRAFADVSFEARAGEIVGFAGLVGAGRTEVMRAVFGIDRPDAGKVEIEGRTLPMGSPRAAIAAGIGLVPESRKEQGLFLNLGVRENLALPGARTRGPGLLRLGAERAAAADKVRELGIVTGSLEQGIGTLSGGNQQKVILARWLALEPKVLIVDEPTRGIDVGAKREIYDLLRAQAAAGRAVVVVSSELPEILELADRVIVMRAGRIAGEIGRHEASEDSIGRLAVGI